MLQGVWVSSKLAADVEDSRDDFQVREIFRQPMTDFFVFFSPGRACKKLEAPSQTWMDHAFRPRGIRRRFDAEGWTLFLSIVSR